MKVVTQSKSATDARYCEEVANRDPNSIYCPYTGYQAPSSAYEVTFWYRGQPMASDEYPSSYFTFSVFLHAEELSPIAFKTLSKRKRAKSAGLFQLKTGRVPIRGVAIDSATSTFYLGNFVDGSWMHLDSKCGDKVNYKTINAPSKYITVRVDPALNAAVVNSSR